MDLIKSLMISASGLKAQGSRMRIIAENLANANSVAQAPGEDPYRRKVVTFKNVLDRETGVRKVEVDRVLRDRGEFSKRYEPTHPSADADGYVLYPNVKSLVEVNDMREAQRSYEANLKAIESAKRMMMSTVDLLR
jgi:flagellar basal-body rod protein FlgC